MGKGKASGLFSGPSSGSERAFQAESDGTVAAPGVCSKRATATDAVSQGGEFRFRLRLIHVRSPLTRKRRVTRKNQPRRNVPLRTLKQRAPAPVLGPLDQVRPQGIAFDVPHHRQQVLVVLDREGLEPALIEMSGASGSVVSVRPHGVRHREPAKELTDLPVTGGPHDEVPVIGHRRKRENGQRNLCPCLVQDA